MGHNTGSTTIYLTTEQTQITFISIVNSGKGVKKRLSHSMSTIVNEKGGRIWGLTWTAAFVLNPPVNIFISLCCPLKL